jgi:hypothetical protein
MEPTTSEDRERELAGLLEQIKAHPEHALTAERDRAAALQAMLGVKERA